MDFAANIAAYLTNDRNAERIADDLAAYYQGSFPAGQGYRFDELCRLASPDRFDQTDFDAVSCLGPAISSAVVDGINARSAELDPRLTALDQQVKFMTIWDSPDSVWGYNGSLLTELFVYLRDTIPGVGGITASKFLACKYPELVPIRDLTTERVIGTDHTGPWGLMWRAALTPDVRSRLYELSSDRVPDHVSLLRRGGVAIWMAGVQHPGHEIQPDGLFAEPTA